MKKYYVIKILQGFWKTILYENNRNNNSYKFSYKFTFLFFLSFRRNQKQESNFQQVGVLLTRNIVVFLFIASRAPLQTYAKCNRLTCFPARTIVPCSKKSRVFTEKGTFVFSMMATVLLRRKLFINLVKLAWRLID